MTVFGIGRVCHIAFWEPHFAGEFATVEEWKKQTHRLGARLHPLTIEQNALTSFKSRTTLVPAFANTIGPALFLAADRIIGGADGAFGRGMQWQGLSLRMTLHHEPTPMDSQHLHADAGGAAVLCERIGGAVGRRMQLRAAVESRDFLLFSRNMAPRIFFNAGIVPNADWADIVVPPQSFHSSGFTRSK